MKSIDCERNYVFYWLVIFSLLDLKYLSFEIFSLFLIKFYSYRELSQKRKWGNSRTETNNEYKN
jgi:hypothetical protein